VERETDRQIYRQTDRHGENIAIFLQQS